MNEDNKIDFLKSVKCKTDIEFYFITILSNFLINRIGKIIHQNDMIFQFLFSELNHKLDTRKYNLEKNKDELRFKFDDKYFVNSLKTFDDKQSNYFENIMNFTENMINSNIGKIKELLGEKEIEKIKKDIRDNNNINEYDDRMKFHYLKKNKRI